MIFIVMLLPCMVNCSTSLAVLAIVPVLDITSSKTSHFLQCFGPVVTDLRDNALYSPFNAHRKVGPCCNSSVLLPIISGHPITVCACSRVGTRRPGWVETWHDPVSLKIMCIPIYIRTYKLRST